MNFESFRGCRICWFAMAIGLMSHVLVIPKSHADEIVIDDKRPTGVTNRDSDCSILYHSIPAS